MKKDQRTLIFLLILILAAAGLGYFLLVAPAGASTGKTSEAKAETPYGEKLEIKLSSGSSTSKASVLASWTASYENSDTQDVYTVGGVYKEQELVTLSYTLSVTHSNVNNIKATVKVKAIDNADQSNYEYTLATQKALSGASPINDNGSTQKSISAHLTDAQASTTSATINYQIYCEVTATGTVSGQSLSAEVPYTQFGQLVYLKSTESSSANVTPSVNVASYVDQTLGIPEGATFNTLAVTALAAALLYAWRARHR